jgi:hypothetical protein
MKASEVARAAWSITRRGLKAHGFTSAGSTLTRTGRGGVIHVLSVQRSQSSTGERVMLAVNYGVYSARVARLRATEDKRRISVEDTHWRRRVHFGSEEWLAVTAEETPEEVARVLSETISRAVLPDLDQRASDEALRDEWLAGGSPGITDLQRMLFLLALLHDLGPQEQVAPTIAALRTRHGTTHGGLIEHDLRLLGLG